MALTDAQHTDCQRWMGYGITARYAYGVNVPYEPLGLAAVLDALTASQEEVLVNIYLTPLATLESDVVAAAANLDTVKAGPWEANPREVSMRTSLFKQKARELCVFLGFEPGPGLGAGGNSIALVRC